MRYRIGDRAEDREGGIVRPKSYPGRDDHLVVMTLYPQGRAGQRVMLSLTRDEAKELSRQLAESVGA